MEPIISPWFIYFLGVVSGIRELAIGVAIVGGMASLGFVGAYIGNLVEKGKDYKWTKWCARYAKRIIPIFAFFIAILIFMPSKNTLIAMYVADNITPNNVEKALEVGKDFKEEIKKDIFELIEAIQKDENKSNE